MSTRLSETPLNVLEIVINPTIKIAKVNKNLDNSLDSEDKSDQRLLIEPMADKLNLTHKFVGSLQKS